MRKRMHFTQRQGHGAKVPFLRYFVGKPDEILGGTDRVENCQIRISLKPLKVWIGLPIKYK